MTIAPPLPEPAVSLEQLTHLLGLQGESATLDYKAECNLNDTRSCIELAKDVAAMQVQGGYIVIGADSNGRPLPPGVPRDVAPLFDEARLRPKLGKWLPQPLQIVTADHVLDGCCFVIIYVAPNTDGFCVIEKDGTYDDGGNQRFIFRRGDVFARHGSSSERWNQRDISAIWDRVVAARKEQWRTELGEELAHLGVARGAQRLIAGPASNYTWRVDQGAFDAATIELFRSLDDIPIRHFLDRTPGDAPNLIDNNEWDELATLVGRVTSLAAMALRYERTTWFEPALKVLMKIYRLGFQPGTAVERRDRKAVDVWLVVLEHLLALGGLAVRLEDWTAVRSIVTRPPVPNESYYTTWLRHGLTMASRARRFDLPDGGSESLLVMAAERANALPALAAGATEDEVVTSMCQFDILAALVIIDETGSLSTSNWYTNFARFYSTRSEPVVQLLLTDASMRRIIFPTGDDMLANALREIDRMATREGFSFNGWWGYQSDEVRSFLAANTPSD